SSRRRHTRSLRDWSSDVCSSDLIGALKSCTKAGTACGGCVPLVTQIMKAEMKKQGMAVNNHVCEHFPYSRQELYHLVRVGKFKRSEERRVGKESRSRWAAHH